LFSAYLAVPPYVRAAQLNIALMRADLMTAMQTAVDSASQEVKAAWDMPLSNGSAMTRI
jgi:ABC-type proline/glycine betaine transport system permease subunit